ncbi:MAG: CDC27 family protein [Saprospiraceae bacterium]
MEQIDQKLIERYLANELTLSERNEVERRAKDDAQFRKDLAECKLSIEAIRLSEREKLKNRFRQRDKMLDQKNNNLNGGKQVSFWWLAVAAAVSVLVAWYFIYAPPLQTIDQAHGDTKDSTAIVQNLPVVIDTIKTNAPKIEDKQPARKKRTTQELYAENFEPYKDDSMDPTSRSGEEDLKPRDRFLLNYWEGNSKEAQVAFNTMSPADKENDNYRFIYANVLMSLNMTKEACLILTGVQKNHKSIYASESPFYLGLCNLKAGKVDEARKNLEAYLLEKDIQHKVNAKKILEELN